MTSLYKVTEIEGKGLGCIAIVEIKKDSVILSESPQICEDTQEVEGSSKWIKSLLKSFYQMSKTDQLQYLKLHNKFNNSSVGKIIEDFKFKIGKIEQDPEKAKEILNICGIFFANSFLDGVGIKMSRFNHSCQPNVGKYADSDGQIEVRAIENIKAGKEISLNYLDEFTGFRNRKYRQKILFDRLYIHRASQLKSERAFL